MLPSTALDETASPKVSDCMVGLPPAKFTPPTTNNQLISNEIVCIFKKKEGRYEGGEGGTKDRMNE